MAEAAGITLVQKLPTMEYELVDQPNFPKLKGDYVFHLNIGTAEFLLVEKMETHSTTELQLSVYELHGDTCSKNREGRVNMQKESTFHHEKYNVLVFKKFLFVVRGERRSILVYDLLEMNLKHTVFISTPFCSFLAVAQFLNIVVLVSKNKNFLFDLDDIITASNDTPIEPTAKFGQPFRIENDGNVSAQISGNNFFLVKVQNLRLIAYHCDLNYVISHVGDNITCVWKNRKLMLPYTDLTNNHLKWIELHRKRVDRRCHNWTNFQIDLGMDYAIDFHIL